MLQSPDDPNGARTFLASWRAEIRAGYTPRDDLDLAERLNEYLHPGVSPEEEAALVAAVDADTALYIAAEKAAEASWVGCTPNDALTAAFRTLDEIGIAALENAGLSIQDGWTRVGLAATSRHHGAVFFHRHDVIDALEGAPLLLAFDVCGAEPGDASAREKVGVEVAERLATYGLGVTWSGDAGDRIALAPFPWQRRRWTHALMQPVRSQPQWTRVPRQRELIVPSADALAPYAHQVRAYRTCFGFDVLLATLHRGAWRLLGGERGQPAHLGPPHTFVRAGELTTMIPRDAFTNLDPSAAAALRLDAMGRRPPPPAEAPKRPWWKF